MREVFDGLPIEVLEINYTVGGAARSKVAAKELLIRSFE